MEQDKVLPKAQVVEHLDNVVNASIEELEELVPDLNHGEAKRLLMAILKYPRDVADFTGDRRELIQSYAVARRLSDALVGLATEVVIDRIINNQMAAESSVSPPDSYFEEQQFIVEEPKAAKKSSGKKKKYEASTLKEGEHA